jgi:hypothetical protein
MKNKVSVVMDRLILEKNVTEVPAVLKSVPSLLLKKFAGNEPVS